MQHPGPYIPATRNRMGARIEWLARLALWEAHEAVIQHRYSITDAFPRSVLGGPWQATPEYWSEFFGQKWYPFARVTPSASGRALGERLKNAETQAALDAMLYGTGAYRYTVGDDGNVYGDATPIRPAAFPWNDGRAGEAFPNLAAEVNEWARKWVK